MDSGIKEAHTLRRKGRVAFEGEKRPVLHHLHFFKLKDSPYQQTWGYAMTKYTTIKACTFSVAVPHCFIKIHMPYHTGRKRDCPILMNISRQHCFFCGSLVPKYHERITAMQLNTICIDCNCMYLSLLTINLLD